MRDALCAFAPPSTGNSGGYAIEKNVPLPPSRRKGKERFPLNRLEVGESFVVQKHEVFAARNAAHRLNKKTGKVFTSRAIENGYRVWRTA
jgi:hypothetical protein